MSSWTTSSWHERRAAQLPTYLDEAQLQRVLGELAAVPPLVTSWEIEKLKGQLAEAAAGKRFLLQGGACAETFDECTSAIVTNKLKILLQMSLILTFGMRTRVIRVGRIAGQYAKPRSRDMETRDGQTLPSYRGDLINGPGFNEHERRHDPERMLRGYERAALTLNFIRGLIDGGFADLEHPEYWDLSFVRKSPRSEQYRQMVASMGDTLSLMDTIIGPVGRSMRNIDFFASHEGLNLHYEQAQTRLIRARPPHREGWYDLTTHYPWIGARTTDLDGAHVEFFRGIRNPIALKIGPTMTPEHLRGLLDVLHPNDEPGRLTLIHRLGAKSVAHTLPKLIDAVRATGKTVLWVCDPMHGNTENTANGFKTRRFDAIVSELEQSMDIHAECGSRMGGVHLELTGEDVTECVGGASSLSEADLGRDYRSLVDPRLNYEQALEVALRIAQKFQAMARS